MASPLVLLSNRGPATFERDSSGELVARRGGGGLVTALTGLLRQREALWIASAMTEEDEEVSRAHGEHSRGDLRRAARQRHHRLPHALLLQQLPPVLP